MSTKESSAEMSALASGMMRRRPMRAAMVDVTTYNDLLADARRLAGSVLSQDETAEPD